MAKFCTGCGSPISEGDSFCGNCGAKINSPEVLNNIPENAENNAAVSSEQSFVPPAEPVNQKKKGGCLKALLIAAVIIIFILLGLVILLASGNSEEPSGSSGNFSSSYTESEAPVAKEEYSSGDYSQSEIDELIKTLDMVLESSSPDSIIYYDIEYLDGILYYNYAIEGIAEAVYGAKDLGFDENFSSWVEYRNSTLDLYDSVKELLVTLGYSDLPLALMVLNDENYDNVFLTIYDGYVFYDVMAD